MAGLGLVVTWAGYLLAWYGFYGLVKNQPVTLRQAASPSQIPTARAAIAASAPGASSQPNAAQIAAAQAAANPFPAPAGGNAAATSGKGASLALGAA